MSKFSVQLRYVCDTFTREEVENWFKDWDLSDYLTPNEINVINQRNTFSKDSLAKQIVDAYYMREIGFETIGLFKHYAKTTMRQIMGEYAQIIYSASIKIDPLVNEDYVESFSRDANNNGSSNTNSTGEGFGITSDTPQSKLTKEQLMNGTYATTATGDTTSTSGNTTANGTEHETYTRSLKGNRGISSNAPYLIQQYRDYIINIYGEIIEKCSDLFMGIY